MLQLSYLSWILIGLIVWACFYRSWKSYQSEDIETLRDFSLFFFHLGLFFVVMGLPGILSIEMSADQLGAFYIFGHIFLYASFAYYSRIPVRILKPEWTTRVFAANLILGAAVTILNFKLWPQPEVHASGVTALHVMAPIGPLIGVLAGLNWILGGTAFFSWRATKKKGKDRLKLLMVAASLVLLSIAGPLHDNTTSIQMLVIADVATLLGVLLMMAGVFYNREMATDTPDYEEGFKAIIRKSHEITGEVAYSRPSDIEYVEIEDREITLKREIGEDEIIELVEEYRNIQGDSANGIARQALKGIVESHHYTELPAELLPFRVKEARFMGL